jgi:hypothetical protein
MDLDVYDDWAQQELEWFRNRLLQEDPEALQASCAALGKSRVLAMLDERRNELREYIETERAQRDTILHRLGDETAQHAFLIAAAYKVRCGALWLDLATSKGLSAGYGPSRSYLMNQAADAALALPDRFPTLWPFEDLADPFD